MGLYASGKAAAIASIKGAVNARVSSLSDGSLALDVGSLELWLAEQFNLVVADGLTPENIPFAKAALGTVSVDAPALANYIGAGNWKSRPDWPTSLSITSGAGFIAALRSLALDMDTALRAIEANYADADDKIIEVLNIAGDALGLDAKLPAMEERIVDTRFYIATYVTDWGEESAPSPVSAMLEVDQDDEVGVTITAPADRPDIVKWRLYRSNVGSVTAAFQGLHEGPLTDLTFQDTYKSAELQEVCPTLTWLEPPAALRGLVGLPNGILAGHFENIVCFSQPYVPYAWPAEYQLTTETLVVGLGVFGQTIFVGTEGSPYFISGSDAASMSQVKLESTEACVSARSIVSLEGGVVYASPNGLCLADSSGVKLLTGALWTSEDWVALQPKTIFAAAHEGCYVFVCATGTWALELRTGKLVSIDHDCTALYLHKPTGTLCAASGEYIVAPFRGTGRRTAIWKTPLITLASQQPMAWAKVYGEQSEAAPATVRWYGDGVLRHTMAFTSLQPQRLPPGRWLEHEVEIESTARITRVLLASTSEELKAI